MSALERNSLLAVARDIADLIRDDPELRRAWREALKPEEEITGEVAMRAIAREVLILAQTEPWTVAEFVALWLEDQNIVGDCKAAALLISLGPEVSSSVLRHLDEEMLHQVTVAIIRLDILLKEVRQEILRDCYEELKIRRYVTDGGANYAQELLVRTIPKRDDPPKT